MRAMVNFNCDKNLTMKPLTKEYLKPEYVYIKIDDPNNLLIPLGSYVYKGQILGETNIPYKLPIISTVSGKLVEIVTDLKNNNKYVKIENDYLEKYAKRKGYKKRLDSYKKEEFIDLLYQNRVVGQGGGGFPTYLKYSGEIPINLLIVNAVECEPHLTADYETMLMHAENIIDAIDAIININGIERAIIAINSKYTDVIDKFNACLGSYPEITLKIMDVRYPLGQSKLLVEAITGELYKNHANEVGVIVNNVSTIYNIYRVLKYRRPVTERVITLTGDKMQKPENVLVKIGMKATELNLKHDPTAIIVEGGPLIGDRYDDFDFVIGPTTLAIMQLKNDVIKTDICINCGKCYTQCPMQIPVVTVKSALAAGDIESLKKLRVETCIKCGLCSYVCPANIMLKEAVTKALEVIKSEK